MTPLISKILNAISIILISTLLGLAIVIPVMIVLFILIQYNLFAITILSISILTVSFLIGFAIIFRDK